MNTDKKAAKAQRNKRHYEKSKSDTEAVLLRLPTGAKAQIDQAASRFGVARPALFELYLLPFLCVIAQHQEVLQELAQRAGCSFPTLMERLILQARDTAVGPSHEELAQELFAEFDAQFSITGGQT